MTILTNIADKLTRLDKRLEKDLPLVEIKTFFILRHLNLPYLATLQQLIIKEWEPRISDSVNTQFSTDISMEKYAELREWLGISDSRAPWCIPPVKPLIKYANKVEEDELFEDYYDDYFYEGD